MERFIRLDLEERKSEIITAFDFFSNLDGWQQFKEKISSLNTKDKGDAPIKYFLSKVTKSNFSKLSDFVKSKDEYGNSQELVVGNKIRRVIPLAHPRQAGKLGSFSKDWYEWHSTWVNKMLTYIS